MNIKTFMNDLIELRQLLDQPRTFSNRIKIKRAKKKIRKMMISRADEYAKIVYKQTVTSLEELANNNLREEIF